MWAISALLAKARYFASVRVHICYIVYKYETIIYLSIYYVY